MKQTFGKGLESLIPRKSGNKTKISATKKVLFARTTRKKLRGVEGLVRKPNIWQSVIKKFSLFLKKLKF